MMWLVVWMVNRPRDWVVHDRTEFAPVVLINEKMKFNIQSPLYGTETSFVQRLPVKSPLLPTCFVCLRMGVPLWSESQRCRGGQGWGRGAGRDKLFSELRMYAPRKINSKLIRVSGPSLIS